MFKTIQDLVLQAEERCVQLHHIMIQQEAEETDKTPEEIWQSMSKRYDVMERAIQTGIRGVTSHSGMTGGDAQKMAQYLQKSSSSDQTLLRCICYAMATNEVNASMGVICATPTAGSSGVLPGVVFALQETHHLSKEEVLAALFTAGAIGYVIANNAFISGAAGGCQAEIGSASAMAAAAAVQLLGGSPTQCAHAMAMALKSLLGLTCDPLAGLVEVPCIKRNATAAAVALSCAEMALAGIESKVPWDEVISAMYSIGIALPETLKETALGGLAATPTGKEWKKKVFPKQD